MILTDCPELRNIPWRCVVIDEAHRLKNRNCKLLEGLKMMDLVSDPLVIALNPSRTVPDSVPLPLWICLMPVKGVRKACPILRYILLSFQLLTSGHGLPKFYIVVRYLYTVVSQQSVVMILSLKRLSSICSSLLFVNTAIMIQLCSRAHRLGTPGPVELALLQVLTSRLSIWNWSSSHRHAEVWGITRPWFDLEF